MLPAGSRIGCRNTPQDGGQGGQQDAAAVGREVDRARRDPHPIPVTPAMAMAERFDYVVVGGGVAGTCCARLLCTKAPKATVCLVSPTEILKTIKVVQRVTDNMDELTVIEQPVASFDDANLTFVKDHVKSLDSDGKRLELGSGRIVEYGKVSLCTGASPRVHLVDSSRVLTVRDTDSAERLSEALARASTRRVVVAGNGAIALEVVNKLRGVEIVWVVKHAHVGDSLLDVDVSLHLLDQFERQNKGKVVVTRRGGDGHGSGPSEEKEAEIRAPSAAPGFAHALGPKWTQSFPSFDATRGTKLDVVYNRSLLNVVEEGESQEGEGENWPVTAILSDGERVGADLVISCIGVSPNTTWLPEGKFDLAEDGGLRVSPSMETSVKDVYAAGDVCTLEGDVLGPQFFQIRLWSQARMTAEFAAHCMVDSAEAELLDLGFDLMSSLFVLFLKHRSLADL